ncbi:helix-turn-helix domain-containing protein [Lactobacillus sp. LL6]|uniref:helix-turn-helix domain-containing protein n=1 Tax=Lactobacillus sp. LL6 TaxID=2596827 RepID=UPI00118499B4|nr:helix-turn-helix domain-containing protein [Lactobacillus sp. LL6]TSO25689.1 helix-turn-helix domain-containing protein [Lactobacillus sp. LL6]
MKDSKRINELIFYLTNNNEFIQAEEIASFLHVSKKTVYRLVKKINDENSAPLIISQRGAGYKLNYQYYMQNKENLELMNSSLTNV